MFVKKTWGILAITLIVAFGVIYYAIIADRNENLKPVPAETNDEVSILIVRDLKTDYPSSPREVIRFYSRIMQSYYDLDYTEEELLQLVDQARSLFDQELLNENDKDEHIKELKIEIEKYKDLKQTITNSKVAEINQIVYYSEAGDDYAKVAVVYTLKNKNGTPKAYEDYMLRKDEEGNWRILGWKITPESELENDK